MRGARKTGRGGGDYLREPIGPSLSPLLFAAIQGSKRELAGTWKGKIPGVA